MSAEPNLFPLTIDEAFAVVERTSAELARDAAHDRKLEEARTWLLACDAASGVNRLHEHLRDDYVTLKDREETRSILTELIANAQKALVDNDREIERQSSLRLPLTVAA